LAAAKGFPSRVSSSFQAGQSDNLIYTEAGIIGVPGLILLVIAVLTLKLWFKSYLAMFRHLGGAIILLTEPYPLTLLGILLLGGAILLVFRLHRSNRSGYGYRSSDCAAVS